MAPEWRGAGSRGAGASPSAVSPDGLLGYSLLYPYSDDVLDDPALPKEEKRAFQCHFRRWLCGCEEPGPLPGAETKVHDQVKLIEAAFDR